jgi:hypothetical protein
MSRFNPWGHIVRREGEGRQHLENTARLAEAYGFFETTGWGEFAVEACHKFGLTFVEEPVVAYGYSIDEDELIELRYPRSFGFVYRWKQDTRGYYVGAWVAFVVDTLSPALIAGVPTEDPMYNLHHTFTFSGVALKDLPTDVLDY